MRFSADAVNKWVDEAHNTVAELGTAAEYTEAARQYAADGYDADTVDTPVEPGVALSFVNEDAYETMVDDLYFGGMVEAFIRQRTRNPDRYTGKSPYVTRQLQEYIELRDRAETYLDEIRDNVETLEAQVQALHDDQPATGDADWSAEDLKAEYGDTYADKYDDFAERLDQLATDTDADE